MSRPYLSISPTYNSTTDVVNLNLTALRLRGVSSLTFTGLSASQTLLINNDGYYVGSFTFSAVLDAATSSATASTVFTSATASITFGGSASNTTNVNWAINGGNILGSGGYTFSATQSTVSAALNLLVGSMIFAPGNGLTGFSATVSGSSIVYTCRTNTGAYYNGFSITSGSASGLGTFTFSHGASFSGGSTQYLFDVNLNNSDFGDISSSSYLIV